MLPLRRRDRGRLRRDGMLPQLGERDGMLPLPDRMLPLASARACCTGEAAARCAGEAAARRGLAGGALSCRRGLRYGSRALEVRVSAAIHSSRSESADLALRAGDE